MYQMPGQHNIPDQHPLPTLSSTTGILLLWMCLRLNFLHNPFKNFCTLAA